MSDREMIDRFLSKEGATQCPPAVIRENLVEPDASLTDWKAVGPLTREWYKKLRKAYAKLPRKRYKG